MTPSLQRLLILNERMHNRYARLSNPTLLGEIVQAREGLTAAETVTLALRHHRRELRLSQRAYAAFRGWSRTRQGRLEADPASLRFGLVVKALEGTGFVLALAHAPGSPVAGSPLDAQQGAQGDGQAEPSSTEAEQAHNGPHEESRPEAEESRPAARERGASHLVDPGRWPAGELVARGADGRRLAGHREIRRTESPWWFARSYQCWAYPPEGPAWTTEQPRRGYG